MTNFKPSPIAYKRTALKSDFMKFPANAIAIGLVGANKGKIIGALGMRNRIEIMDPDTGEVIRTYGMPDYPVKGVDDVSEAADGTLYFSNAAIGTIGYIAGTQTAVIYKSPFS